MGITAPWKLKINFMNKEPNTFAKGDVVGRDKYVQTGSGSKISIDNSTSGQKKWYEKWWGIVIIGVVVVLLAAILTNFFGLTKP